jgi:hypothetical protein
MHGIIRRIATAVGAVMATSGAMAVTVAEVAIRHSAQRVTVKFSSSHSSRIRATSTQTLDALSAIKRFISISLHTAAESSSTSLVRRGRSILALIIPSSGITSRPRRAERASSSARRPSRKNQNRKLANPKNRRVLRLLSLSQFRHALRRGLRLAGCRSSLRGLFRDR